MSIKEITEIMDRAIEYAVSNLVDLCKELQMLAQGCYIEPNWKLYQLIEILRETGASDTLGLAHVLVNNAAIAYVVEANDENNVR